ncbi:hypothetical protein [Streptomyces chrestomyceticus]|uniref:hypothetical protein n=1 Tax=Streptomyces chrestomyceticus TaxID=68185 RepID=UPI0033F90A7D
MWSSGAADADQLLDLVDMNGNPLSMLTADQNGMVPAFYGPEGYAYVWVDFGAGRYMMLPTDTIRRVQEHVTGADPHGDRNYSDSLFDQAVPKRGGSVSVDRGQAWLSVQVPTGDGDDQGAVLRVTDGGAEYTRLRNDGALVVDPIGPHTPLAVGASGDAPFLTCHRGRANASADGSVFTIASDGSVTSSGTVRASNLGSARLFSGPTPPSDPQVGDVWVMYAE